MKAVVHVLSSILIIGVILFAHAALTLHHFEHHSHDGHAHHHSDTSDEECPVCDFDFAAFALYGQITISQPTPVWLRTKSDRIPYFEVKSVVETNCLRGPPALM